MIYKKVPAKQGLESAIEAALDRIKPLCVLNL
jgi:hypothetical protein